MRKHTRMLVAVLLTVLAVCFTVSAREGVVPGINVFTGNTSAYDFEGDVSNVVFYGEQAVDSSGKTVNAVVVREDANGNASNHAASVKGNSGYFYIDVDFPVIDKDRPVKVSYDYILGLDGNQVRTLINYPTKYSGSQREKASFNISYFGAAQTSEIWRNVTHTQTPATKCKTGNSYYQGGEDMEFLSFVNYSGKAQASYFDNLYCVPYYKVSYDINGGNGSADNEYFLQDAGTKYTLLNAGESIYKNGYAFKGWALSADADASEVVTEITVETGKDVQLYAVWQEDETVPDKYFIELYDGEVLRDSYVVSEGEALVLPELEFTDGEFLLGWATADGNMLVGYQFYPESDLKLYAKWGKTETLPGVNVFENSTFEGEFIDVRPSNGKVEIVDEDGNAVLKYTRNSDYASLQHCVSLEAGRSYKVQYRVKIPAEAYITGNLIYNDTNHLLGTPAAADTWAKHTVSFTVPADTEESVFESKKSDAISIYSNPLGGVENVMYLDDISFVPYYKVTYNANGGVGEVPETEYFLDEKYTVKSDVILERDGYNFLGWTLKNGSVNLASEVTPVPGEDIELFAAWENVNALNAVSYEFLSDEPGIANGTITVTLNDETASYTGAEILLADNDGVLDDYTPFGDMTFTDGIGTYTVSGNRAFPTEATRLAVKFTAEGLDDLYYWYTIPDAHLLSDSEEPLYSFWALSDSHLGGTNYSTDYWPTMTVNRNNAFEDVFASDADFAFINGDVINYGSEDYTKVLDSYLEDRLNNSEYNPKNIPVFLANGNHEYYDAGDVAFDYAAIEASFNGQVDYLENKYGDEMKIVRGGEDELWYSVEYKGAKLIFLSVPQISADRLDGSSFTISEEQLKFLDEQLYEGEKSGKTNYVITHAPLQNTIPKNSTGGYEGGVSNTAAVNRILAKHPNTIVFSAHSHSDLSVDDAHFTVVGDMINNPSHINDGCLVWISAWEGLGEYENGTQTRYKKSFSTGVYLEVYSDKILVKSRQFLDDSQFFGHGVYVIDVPGGGTDIPDVAIEGTVADGAVLNALVGGSIPADDAAYTYEWSIGNEIVCTEKTYTVDIKGSFAGEYVALRVIFEDGTYASALSDTKFSGVNVSYDANGGTGTVPKAHTWIPGEYMLPDIESAFPKKEGKFFVGWSDDANATEPEASILVNDDIVLYAVYSDKPEFYFDSNLSGFKSNGYVSEINDGVLRTSSLGGDLYYTWTNSSFSADTYKYMRIKSRYESGSSDGMFFGVDGSGVSGTRRMALSSGSAVATMTDGMVVKEYDMTVNAEWTSNITTLRYDVLSGAGKVFVDYVVFSDKKGVYKINITSESGNTGTVSDDSHVTLNSITREGNILHAVVTPKEGYEFTLEDELEINAKINDNPINNAVINRDGTATLTIDFDDITITSAEFTIGEGETDPFYASFGANLGKCSFVAAAYDEDGRLLGVDTIKKADDIDGKVTVYVAKSLDAALVKVMAFGSFGSLKPICAEAQSVGNLIINGDAQGEETTAFYSENGTVSIVEDSEKGKVWETVASATGKYVYFQQEFTYTPGATYKVSADIKLVGTPVSNDVSGSINLNTRYYDANGKRDHVLIQTSVKAGVWNHIEHVFTVPADITVTSDDEFTFYCNPITVNEVSCGATYRVANINVQYYP